MRAIALGNFDGVHRAHQAVLQAAARQQESICLLFQEHPRKILTGKAPERLLTAEQTEQKILSCGISRCVYLDFSAIKALSPVAFFEQVLLKEFEAEAVCCGFNYRFGKDRSGDVALLERLCRERGVQFAATAPVLFKAEPISSSRIRACIREGAIEKANAMLGYNFFYESAIERGKQLGRTLGFPTINQALPPSLVKPLSGVYASRVTIGGTCYRGLTNIGDNPTIGGERFRSETHLFDFSREAYGETATVELTAFIRREQKFDSRQALQRQVKADIERAKANV